MSKNLNINPMKVITDPDTRWSYATVWEAKSINGGAPKFSVSLIIPKSDVQTGQKLKLLTMIANQSLKAMVKSVPPLSAIKTPLIDGDVERPDDSSYSNAYFINANSATAPGIVDANRQKSSLALKYIAAFMVEPVLHYMLLTVRKSWNCLWS